MPLRDVSKEIVKSGGDLVVLPEVDNIDTKVVFHVKSTLAGSNKVLDDSREWSKPMELILGHNFKFSLWEELVKTMRVGETSIFTCKHHTVSDYPKVASQLRKIMIEKKAIEPEHHCCGSQAFVEQSTGYHDLDHVTQEKNDICFTIEILSVHRPGCYEKELWTLTDDEKRRRTMTLKEEGNTFFHNQDINAASERYSMAIGLLDQLILKEKPGSSMHTELNSERTPILLNWCQCQLKLGNNYPVIQYASEVLTHDPHNVKALFRRALAHKAVFNYREALEDLEKTASLDESLINAINKQIKEIKAAQASNDAKDKELFKNMLKI